MNGPSGSQSIYDSSMLGVFYILRMYGSFVTLMYVAARFEYVRKVYNDNALFLTIACTINSGGWLVYVSVACVFASQELFVSTKCLSWRKHWVKNLSSWFHLWHRFFLVWLSQWFSWFLNRMFRDHLKLFWRAKSHVQVCIDVTSFSNISYCINCE